jgi:phage shock protein A
VDTDGVALAAIQGLYEVVKEKDAQITELKENNEELNKRLSALEELIYTNHMDPRL